MWTHFLVQNKKEFVEFTSYIEATKFAQDLSKKEPGRKIEIFATTAIFVTHQDLTTNTLTTDIEDLF